MKYKYIVLLILILFISGCVENLDKTVYFSKKSNETVNLYKDGTFTAISSKTSVSGAYRIDGDYIVFIYPPFGTVGKARRSGNSFINEKTGETWEKI